MNEEKSKLAADESLGKPQVMEEGNRPSNPNVQKDYYDERGSNSQRSQKVAQQLKSIGRLSDFLEALGDETIDGLETIIELLGDTVDDDGARARFSKIFELAKKVNANNGVQSLFWMCTPSTSLGNKMPLELITNDDSLDQLTNLLNESKRSNHR